MSNKIVEIDLYDVRNEDRYRDNIDRYGDTSDTCFICGKLLKEGYDLVHYTEYGNLTNSEDDNYPNSQGWFPVGSDCIKKVKKALKNKIKEIENECK